MIITPLSKEREGEREKKRNGIFPPPTPPTTVSGPARILHSFVDAVLTKGDTAGVAGAKIYITFLIDSIIDLVKSKSKLTLEVSCRSNTSRHDLLTKRLEMIELTDFAARHQEGLH